MSKRTSLLQNIQLELAKQVATKTLLVRHRIQRSAQRYRDARRRHSETDGRRASDCPHYRRGLQQQRLPKAAKQELPGFMAPSSTRKHAGRHQPQKYLVAVKARQKAQERATVRTIEGNSQQERVPKAAKKKYLGSCHSRASSTAISSL